MLVRRLIELVAPHSCLDCGLEGELLCGTCLPKVAIAPERCYRCGRSSAAGETCATCQSSSCLSSVVVAAVYEGSVKELILALKFKRSRSASVLAARLIVQRMEQVPECDLITAVPVAPARYRERGYNQAELIARELARQLQRPYAPLLARTTTGHQLGQGRKERFKQVEGAFYVPRQLGGQSVLIIDDVVTTGATLGECARVLAGAGVGEVFGAAVARH